MIHLLVSANYASCGATPSGGSRPSDTFLPRDEGLDHAETASVGFMVVSDGVLSEGCGHGGLGVCLGDGQTEAEYRRKIRPMPPYLT